MEQEKDFKMVRDLSLWVGLKSCGQTFNTDFITSIIEKYDEYGTLTDAQRTSLENIYLKCKVQTAIRFYELVPYKAVSIRNLEAEEKCSKCYIDLNEWIFDAYGENDYTDIFCGDCFKATFKNEVKDDKPKRKYTRKTQKQTSE